jgi:hypothetical protein
VGSNAWLACPNSHLSTMSVRTVGT